MTFIKQTEAQMKEVSPSSRKCDGFKEIQRLLNELGRYRTKREKIKEKEALLRKDKH